MHVINIGRSIKSLNQFNGRHWKEKHQESKIWERLIWEAFLAKMGRIPKFTGKVQISVLSKRNRLLDYDNLVGGCKFVIDAVKRLGIIVDDTPALLRVNYCQEVLSKDYRGTEISITEDSSKN